MTEFRPTMQERKNRRVGYFVLVAEPAAWKNPQYFRGNGHSCGFSNRQNIYYPRSFAPHPRNTRWTRNVCAELTQGLRYS